MHYHALGEGPAVVMVHGSGPGASGWSNFRHNAQALADGGFRVLVPDLLGYGRSSMPADYEYRFERHVDALARLLDAAGAPEAALVGNSLGGALCIGFALTHPGRTRKLVLMAPGGLEERETYMKMRGIRAMLRTVYGEDGITLDGMRRLFGLQVHEGKVAEDVIEERTKVALTQPRAVFETVGVPNLTARLGELSCPVLGFWGADDQFCPVSGATTLATGCLDAEVVLFSRCGHWVMVERTETFNRRTVEFLCAP
ncbi:MAG: alpha/beta fold hydrolase [Deltaproteobacteria bacterium]|nr:alpha/beta fold hydrolase [Deltaproteobacteria bacterium]MCB9785088.1 alpha/beta fold hydrolase [Deltaproteobacteria bacterium]